MSLAEQTLKLVEDREKERFRRALRTMVSDLRDAAPVDTGETRRQTDSERVDLSGQVWSALVAAKTPQAKFTDEGTGIFGPTGRMITPKQAKVLRWIDKVDGPIFRPRSKGSGKHKGWFSKTILRWPRKLQEA